MSFSKDEIQEMRDHAKDPEVNAFNLAEDVFSLLFEIDRLKEVHTYEQRRSADRLREAEESAAPLVSYARSVDPEAVNSWLKLYGFDREGNR